MLRMNGYFNGGCCSAMLSGLAPSQNSLMFWPTAAMRLNGVGRGVSVPSGYPAPQNGAAPAVTSGAMSTYKKGVVALTGAAVGAMGLCRTAAGSVALNAEAIGGLVAGGVAAGALELEGSADIFATLGTTAEGVITTDGFADIMGVGHAGASGTATLAGEVEAYALGWAVATTEQTAEMTEASISAAVWAYVLGASSAGDLLQGAGASGDPWLSDLNGYTGEQAGAIIAQIQTLAEELHRLQGLDPAAPMTVTPTSRVAGGITLVLSGDGETSTTVARA